MMMMMMMDARGYYSHIGGHHHRCGDPVAGISLNSWVDCEFCDCVMINDAEMSLAAYSY